MRFRRAVRTVIAGLQEQRLAAGGDAPALGAGGGGLGGMIFAAATAASRAQALQSLYSKTGRHYSSVSMRMGGGMAAWAASSRVRRAADALGGDAQLLRAEGNEALAATLLPAWFSEPASRAPPARSYSAACSRLLRLQAAADNDDEEETPEARRAAWEVVVATLEAEAEVNALIARAQTSLPSAGGLFARCFGGDGDGQDTHGDGPPPAPSRKAPLMRWQSMKPTWRPGELAAMAALKR
jgi:hypothetical protein